jgi:DnaJ-class molecular chaperone
MMQTDYYHVLGIAKGATFDQIKDAYRKLAFKYHPDRTQEAGNADRMKQINEAYAVLSDSTKRREYDSLRDQFGPRAYNHFRQTYSEQDIFQGSNINQIFEEMARSFGLRGFDQIFKDFYGDEVKRFQYRRPGLFAGGFIFSGRSGQRPTAGRILLPRGAAGLIGYLFNKMSGLTVPQKGKDMTDTIVLSPEEALQGGPYAYYHRRKDRKLVVKIPPGVRQGQKIRLAGQGGTGHRGGELGDLYLDVRIKTPVAKKIKAALGGLLGAWKK